MESMKFSWTTMLLPWVETKYKHIPMEPHCIFIMLCGLHILSTGTNWGWHHMELSLYRGMAVLNKIYIAKLLKSGQFADTERKRKIM